MSKITQHLEFYFNVMVSVMLLVVTGFYIANVNQPYYQDMNIIVMTTLVATLVLSLVPFGLKYLHSKQVRFLFSSVLKFALPSFIIFSGVKFLAMRVESFGYIFASNLEAGNEAAMTAATQAVLLLVLFGITWLVSIVTAFLSAEA